MGNTLSDWNGDIRPSACSHGGHWNSAMANYGTARNKHKLYSLWRWDPWRLRRGAVSVVAAGAMEWRSVGPPDNRATLVESTQATGVPCGQASGAGAPHRATDPHTARTRNYEDVVGRVHRRVVSLGVPEAACRAAWLNRRAHHKTHGGGEPRPGCVHDNTEAQGIVLTTIAREKRSSSPVAGADAAAG